MQGLRVVRPGREPQEVPCLLDHFASLNVLLLDTQEENLPEEFILSYCILSGLKIDRGELILPPVIDPFVERLSAYVPFSAHLDSIQ